MGIENGNQSVKCDVARTDHVLHADADFAIAVESAIESDDVWRVALVQNHQFTNDLIANGRLYLQVDQLKDTMYATHMSE